MGAPDAYTCSSQELNPAGNGQGVLIDTVATYLSTEECLQVAQALNYARALHQSGIPGAALSGTPDSATTIELGFAYAESVAQILAEITHAGVVALAAALLYRPYQRHLISSAQLCANLGTTLGEKTCLLLERIEWAQAVFARVSSDAGIAATAVGPVHAAIQAKKLGHRAHKSFPRQEAAKTARRLIIEAIGDPRVVAFELAQHLWLLRAIVRTFGVQSPATVPAETVPAWAAFGADISPEARLLLAKLAHDVYAPLSGRLGLGLMESALHDLAFAISEPDAYEQLLKRLADFDHLSKHYIEQVRSSILGLLASVGIHAEVTGRIKSCYGIWKKLRRDSARDISAIQDAVGMRIVVGNIEDCYSALGYVHSLWCPVDRRIKDFIARPLPSGYRSLHTTVQCIEGQTVEFQIRTHDMHRLAEYGLHWLYKRHGDGLSASLYDATSTTAQVQKWQKQIRGAAQVARNRSLESNPQIRHSVGNTVIVFTRDGDPRELPQNSTALDFAYTIHSELGNHAAFARVRRLDPTGQESLEQLPLSYRLHAGDVIEVVTLDSAHPQREWLRFVVTRKAENRIRRFLKQSSIDYLAPYLHDSVDRVLETFEPHKQRKNARAVPTKRRSR